MKRLAFPFLVLAVWGCDQDPPVESADLRRPSGLVEITRPDETIAGLSGTAVRSDVLIVDSEAQGVRVVQYARTTTAAPAASFVPAPVVYFPLIVSAPGYPTRIAANASGTLAYVIATADVGQDLDAVRVARSYLHVLSVPGLGYQGRVSTTDYFLVDSIDITEPVPGEVFIPVDVVALPSEEGVDRIAIAYDALGSSSGRVQILDFATPASAPTAPTELTPTASEIHEVPGGVTELTVYAGRVYTTSTFVAATSSVANVITEIEPKVGVTGGLDAGGPTGHLVSAGSYGLLALRSDIPSVVVFEGDPPVRSTASFPSPFTPPAERALDPDLPGRIDLHDSPLGPGAFAPNVPVLRFDSRVVTSTNAPGIVLVTHVDGSGSFLYAPRIDDVTVGPFNLGVIRESFVTTVWSTGGGATIGECSFSDMFGEDSPEEDPNCSDGVVQVPLPNDRRFRARFRGALARSRSSEVTSVETSTSVDWRLEDLGGIDFESRKVRIGDTVRMVDTFPGRCDADNAPADIAERTVEARVVAVDGSELDLVVVSGPVPLPCAEGMTPFFYEVFPTGDEGVLTQIAFGDIEAVIERVPLSVDGNLEFGVTVDDDGVLPPVRFTMTGTFECLPRTDGDICNSLLECATGWSCVAPTTTNEEEGTETTSAGLSRCTESVCTEDVCLVGAFNRGCPGVEVSLLGTDAANVDLRRDTTVGGTSVPSTAPDDAISFDEGRYFMVSYPGARSIVEVRSGSSLVIDQRR